MTTHNASLPPAFQWFQSDPLARELCQVAPEEIERLGRMPGVTFRPVMLPTPRRVVAENDYFDWPIACMAGDTIIVLFDRRCYHFGGEGPRSNADSGVRMITTSSDGGRTWSEPVDVLEQAGQWPETVFGGWGGGLGVCEDTVYLALNEGLYRSKDRGANWALACEQPDFGNLPEGMESVSTFAPKDQKTGKGPPPTPAPFWSPGMRLTFDSAHGLTIWTTRGFKPTGRDPSRALDYGRYLCAWYSPDFGKTWHLEDQPLPETVSLNEVTPLAFRDGELAFFLRTGGYGSYHAQAYSATGWFPFEVAPTNVGGFDRMDTPDLIFNPRTGRLEATVTSRSLTEPMELRLFSIDPDRLAAGDADWRFERTLLRFWGPFGAADDKCDGMNPVGGVVDEAAGLHRLYIWAGDTRNRAGIFEYARPLGGSAPDSET